MKQMGAQGLAGARLQAFKIHYEKTWAVTQGCVIRAAITALIVLVTACSSPRSKEHDTTPPLLTAVNDTAAQTKRACAGLDDAWVEWAKNLARDLNMLELFLATARGGATVSETDRAIWGRKAEFEISERIRKNVEEVWVLVPEAFAARLEWKSYVSARLTAWRDSQHSGDCEPRSGGSGTRKQESPY